MARSALARFVLGDRGRGTPSPSLGRQGLNLPRHLLLPEQPRQTRFEVWTERVQLRLRQKSVLERRLAEAAQQRTPMVVRTEQMIAKRIVVVLPAVSRTMVSVDASDHL
jgi:hypothetical protein